MQTRHCVNTESMYSKNDCCDPVNVEITAQPGETEATENLINDPLTTNVLSVMG